MNYPVLVKVLVGVVCIMGVGCSNSETSLSSESQSTGKGLPLDDKASVENRQVPVDVYLTTYLQGVEDKLDKLKDKHAKLVGQVKEAAPGSDSIMALEATLDELTKNGEEIQFQIEALKSAKSEDFQALQAGMDQRLADLDQSYDKALAPFAG
jgi:hypothetical protein